jgi:threonine/homoserine/homoserine lactone efflux protein
MNPVLLIFTQIAIAGCGFLLYFLFALWRDSHKGPKVKIRRVTTGRNQEKIIQLYTAEELRARQARRAGQ